MKRISLILLSLLLALTMLMPAFAETAVTEPVEAVEVESVAIGEGETVFGLQVLDIEGNILNDYTVSTNEKTVGAALLALDLIAGEESQYGLYVKTVCGVTADYDVDKTYWSFWINGEYAMTGVDATEIEPGALYTLAVAGA